MWAALQLHLCHHLVRDDLGDQADEPVAGGPADLGRILGPLGLRTGERGEFRAVDHLAAGRVGARGQLAGADPATNGVVTDAEQPSGFG